MFLDNVIGDKRPISWVLQFWPVIVASFVCALAATALCKKIALKFGIVDKPDNLVKTHKEPVAYLGGIGILVGFTVGVLTGLYLVRDMELVVAFRWLLGILGGAAIACFVGVIDDLFDISPGRKMLGQVAAAAVLVAAGIRPALHYVTGVFNVEMSAGAETWLGVPVVIFFVLGATNSLNLLDGLDGLCAGVTGIITLAMLLLAIHLGTWEFSNVGGDCVRVVVCLAIVGGVFGFLPFNRHPAKIFMGDAGSMLLGFVVATLMILFAERTPRWWMASIVVFGLPILDTATALVRRLINKRPLFVSDRGHLYDQLMDRGLSLRSTVKICYALAALYAAIGLIMSQIRTRYALIVYIIVFAISGVVVWKKGFLKMMGIRGAIRKSPPAP
jgi:UDP-GlcNAc:undecaprenyl-phosphate GlcNAc-1-phosphate transferase